jgi:hypothetical protein
MKITLSGSIIYEAVPHYEWRPHLPLAHTEHGALLWPQANTNKDKRNAESHIAENIVR